MLPLSVAVPFINHNESQWCVVPKINMDTKKDDHIPEAGDTWIPNHHFWGIQLLVLREAPCTPPKKLTNGTWKYRSLWKTIPWTKCSHFFPHHFFFQCHIPMVYAIKYIKYAELWINENQFFESIPSKLLGTESFEKTAPKGVPNGWKTAYLAYGWISL